MCQGACSNVKPIGRSPDSKDVSDVSGDQNPDCSTYKKRQFCWFMAGKRRLFVDGKDDGSDHWTLAYSLLIVKSQQEDRHINDSWGNRKHVQQKRGRMGQRLVPHMELRCSPVVEFSVLGQWRASQGAESGERSTHLGEKTSQKPWKTMVAHPKKKVSGCQKHGFWMFLWCFGGCNYLVTRYSYLCIKLSTAIFAEGNKLDHRYPYRNTSRIQIHPQTSCVFSSLILLFYAAKQGTALRCLFACDWCFQAIENNYCRPPLKFWRHA